MHAGDDAAAASCESSSEFMCESNGVCINKMLRCDGVPHCDDGSDERACNYTGTHSYTSSFCWCFLFF